MPADQVAPCLHPFASHNGFICPDLSFRHITWRRRQKLTHPRVCQMLQTDPSKRAEPFFKTDDGCTMIRMQDFQGQTLKFINNQDFKLDNQFGWVNEYGGTIPAKSMRIFKTADSVWYISEMKPPSVDKKKAVAYNVGEIDAHGYVEDNSRWPGKLNSYPPNEGWAGSMDATPQTKASFQCVCFFKHPEECSEKNVPRSVSVEVSSRTSQHSAPNRRPSKFRNLYTERLTFHQPSSTETLHP